MGYIQWIHDGNKHISSIWVFPFFCDPQILFCSTQQQPVMDAMRAWERERKEKLHHFCFLLSSKIYHLILFSIPFFVILAHFRFIFSSLSVCHTDIYSHLKSVDYFRLCIVYKRETSFSLFVDKHWYNGKNGEVNEREKRAHNLFFPLYEWADIWHRLPFIPFNSDEERQLLYSSSSS